MQAVTYDRYGGPEVLDLIETATCRPSPNELLIRVEHASVNPIDARMRRGEMKWMLPGGFPRIPGYDVAGVVVAAPGWSRFSIGERVMAFLRHLYGGGYAQYATCSPRSAAAIPDAMPSDQAAAIPLAGSTALQSLCRHGDLESGHRVLINGASGGVGCFAVQIAASAGAEVTGVASGENEPFVRSLGASSFIDYHQTDFTTTGQHWDLIFDAAGKTSFEAVKGCLSPHGRFVSTEPSVRGLMTSLFTAPMAKRGRIMLATSRSSDLQTLVAMYQRGALKVVLDQVLPLREAAEAHRRIESGGTRGKLVLEVPHPE